VPAIVTGARHLPACAAKAGWRVTARTRIADRIIEAKKESIEVRKTKSRATDVQSDASASIRSLATPKHVNDGLPSGRDSQETHTNTRIADLSSNAATFSRDAYASGWPQATPVTGITSNAPLTAFARHA
jgi:hypothetical protein